MNTDQSPVADTVGNPPAIEIRDLVTRYGDQVAVDNVSLAVEPGVFLTFLGPSGCGKSTLLRSIAGFARPENGTILVAGRDITHEVPYRRPVGMVFQDYALFPHMSVRQNIAFGLEMQGLSGPQIAERCEQMLALIHLSELGNRFPEQLSGGQQQRVALARALAPDPGSLLLDEPLGALDLKLRRQMQQELKRIQRQTGKTFVFVTHDQEEAMSMSDQIAVMRAGRIEQIGTPAQIYRRPATAFVAGFIGDANILPAQVAQTDKSGVSLHLAEKCWRVPHTQVTAATPPQAGSAVAVVIRPEDLRVEGPAAEDDLVLAACVEDRTYLGNRMRLTLRSPDGLGLIAETGEREPLRSAELLELRCAPGDVAIVESPSTTNTAAGGEGRAKT